jgi:PAS domain S-box-containing protein
MNSPAWNAEDAPTSRLPVDLIGIVGQKEQASLLNAILENAPDIVLYVDLEGTIGFFNRLPPTVVGEDVIGKYWLEFVAPEHHAKVRAAFDEAVASGEPTDIELLGRGHRGTAAWYWTRIGPVHRDGETIGVVLMSRDITDKKRTETQLLLSDRMASVGSLAAGVAHEINNPLAAVMANLELAIRHVRKLESACPVALEIADELRDAREAGERVRQIVRDLKVFSRVEDDQRGPVDVEHVLESTLRMTWNEIRHRARLVKNYGLVPPVEANDSRLGQVFLNLIVNAAQSIPEGDARKNKVEISTSMAPDGRVVVRIADTGRGMTAETRGQLFTPFFTTKPAGVGTGLGLPICHRIVTSFGGEIAFDSELGEGTEFRVYLPVAKGPCPTVESVSSIAPAPALRRVSVLVVDDDSMSLRALQRILRDEDVTLASSASEALELIARRDPFDVVLCDLMMPQMSGIDFHDALRAEDPEQAKRIVFMTGGAFTPRAREFLASGALPVIEKPFDFQGLRTLIRSYLP